MKLPYRLIKYRKHFVVVSGSLIGIVLLLLLFRNSILQWAIHKTEQKFEHKYHGRLNIQKSSFSGISTVVLSNIYVQSPQKDTLLNMAEVQAGIKVWPLLFGNIRLNSVFIDSVLLNVCKSKEKDNISFLLKQSKKAENTDSTTDYQSYNLGAFTNRILETIFDIIPNRFEMYNSHINIQKDTVVLNSILDSVVFINEKFHGHMVSQERNMRSEYKITGNIYKNSRTLNFTVSPTYPKQEKSIPGLKSFFNLTIGFDTLNINLSQSSFKDNKLILQGKASVSNGLINHWRISPKNITVHRLEADFNFSVENSFLCLDSNSVFRLNKMFIKPNISFENVNNIKTMAININIPLMESQDFFESFPEGLFQNIEGIKTAGRLGYKMHFYFNSKFADSVEFTCQMPKDKFKILAFGETPLNKINDEFLYTAYEKGIAVRSFMVGSSNPDYTPLSLISPFLQYAVMTSEDGNFMWHNGFNEEAFRKSIAENYKQGRFARGGSTISMQLVKNVFLTRNKTIARKIEEALIVWLIESNRIVSKERMLEVYLNIIEWGPGVYGIGEASRYYFNKKPSDLSLAESIYLAMIIPRPKWFKYNFDENGKLKEHTADYYRIIAGHLVKKEIISEEQKELLNNDIHISGKAKELILKPDSALHNLNPVNSDFIDNTD